MKLSELKNILPQLQTLKFKLENGKQVPVHFHVTEVGKVHRNFIDCGGTVRNEYAVNFQLWNDDDTDNRLEPAKLLNIIQLSEEKLGITDGDIEVEYQGATIGKFGLEIDGDTFLLTATQTACLAQDACGIPAVKPKMKLSEHQAAATCCTPNSGCC